MKSRLPHGMPPLFGENVTFHATAWDNVNGTDGSIAPLRPAKRMSATAPIATMIADIEFVGEVPGAISWSSLDHLVGGRE
jgi:hypothetical protein